MDIETSILCEIQDARGYEEAEGDGDDEIDGDGRRPASKGVNSIGLEVEFMGGYLLDGH